MGKVNDKAAQFSQKMCDILNYGALNTAMGIGYASGAFEALAACNEPEPSDVIAERAGLNERYLYEWLGVMVAGGIVTVQEDENEQERFFLPREYVPFLTSSGGNSNLGVYMQEIPLLARCSLQEVTDGMQSGNGISYEKYQPFYSFMEELANAKHEQVLVQKFLPSVADGQIVEQLKRGIHVCDVGCAEGVVVSLMAQAFPNSTFVGTDISEKSIARAQERAEALGLSNVSFRVEDAAGYTIVPAQFDYIMAFDSIHDQTRPFEALKNIYTMLKPDGLFSMIDIAASSSVAQNAAHPMGAFLYTVSLMHCMPVGLVDDGMGLGMMWGKEQAVSLCNVAGFSDVEVLDIPEDGFNYHYLCRK